jgi:biotin carboxyl carrier protein
VSTSWIIHEERSDAAPRAQRVELQRALPRGGAGAVVALVDGEPVALDVRPLADGRLELRRGEERRRVRAVWTDDGELLLVEGGEQRRYQVEDARASWLRQDAGAGGASGEVRASMPGRVVRLPRALGEAVAPGDVVAVLEAMKMENDVKATVAGVIAAIAVTEGDAVEQRALLLRIEAAQ